LITEFGIGNGVSLIIFAGIVAGLPSTVQNIIFSYDPSQLPALIAFLLVGVVIVTGVVFITEAERPIPVTYSREARGGGKSVSTYLPLRLNQAGVIPIIFAISILLLPNIISSLLINVNNLTVQNIAGNINAFISNQFNYGVIYFILVFLLTYFYTAVTFDPDNTAKNLQKSGAFIPGVRPGEQTAKYVGNVLSRITLVGALFLGFIAVIPIIVQSITGITSISIGGTALLIAVSVAIDLVKKIDSQVSMREY
jgi:preprotein translocase subunit SecY